MTYKPPLIVMGTIPSLYYFIFIIYIQQGSPKTTYLIVVFGVTTI